MTMMNDIHWKTISTFWSTDHNRKALVNVDKKTCCYFIDYFLDEVCIGSKSYPEKSLYWVEDCAENFTTGVLYPDGKVT
jgi:hypothetical protein